MRDCFCNLYTLAYPTNLLERCFKWVKHKLKFIQRCRNRENFGGAKEFCPDSPKLAQKILKYFKINDVQKKAFHVNSGALWSPKKSFSYQFGRHYFQIKACWAPFFLSGSFRTFSKILRGFAPNQNFWGCSCTPASYTSVFIYHKQNRLW